MFFELRILAENDDSLAKPDFLTDFFTTQGQMPQLTLCCNAAK
jgi:hypothetical protein